MRSMRSRLVTILLLLITAVIGVLVAYFLHFYLFGHFDSQVLCEAGCNERETPPPLSYQWTTDKAKFRLPYRETPVVVNLRLSGGSRPDPLPEVYLAVANKWGLAQFLIAREERVYSFILPPQAAGDVLSLYTTAFQAGDGRDLGVVFFEARLDSLSPFRRIPISLMMGRLGVVFLGAVAFFLWLSLFKYPLPVARPLSLSLLALMVLTLTFQPTWWAWPWPAALSWLLGLLLAPLARIPRVRQALTRPDVARSLLHPVSVGLLAGLVWGLLSALIAGLPIIVMGQGTVGLWPRLLAICYLMAIYALLFAFLFGVLGLLATLILGLAGMSLSRIHWLVLYLGLASGLTFVAEVLQRFGILEKDYQDFRLPGLIIVGLVALILAAVVAWIVKGSIARWQAGRGFLRPLTWKALQALILVPGGAVLLILLAQVAARQIGLDQLIARPSPNSASPRYPNIVLITVDSLRADFLGTYGNIAHGSPSPYLDQLAQEGVVFETVTAPASWPLATMASLHTSLYPSALGIFCRPHLSCQVRLDSQRTTLAEALAQAGFRTQAYVANPWFSPSHGFAQGFAGYEATRASFPMDLENLRSQQAWIDLVLAYVPSLSQPFEQGYLLLLDTRLGEANDGESVTARARTFIDEHQGERFFLWLHYADTHLPHDPSQPFPLQIVPSMFDWKFWDVSSRAEYLLDPGAAGQFVSLYAGEIVDVDALVGKVLTELDAQNLANSTIVVVTADNGEEFGEHGDFAYGHTLYQEIVHVPLIIRGPSLPPGRRVSTPVSLLDLLPTLAEMAGAARPAEAQGRSLLPAMSGQELDEQPVYAESLYRRYYEWKMLRQGRYKLLYDVDRDRLELYDLAADPGEKTNLATVEPARAQEMLQKLRDWMGANVQTATRLPRSDRTWDIDPAVARLLIDMGAY